MLNTNPFLYHFQASNRTKIISNKLTIRTLHRLSRPVWNYPRIGLDIVSFVLRIGAYFDTLTKIKSTQIIKFECF